MTQGFDLRTHYRNSKGNVERVDPYHLHIVDGVLRFERPIGSGDMYDAQGTLIVKGDANEAKQAATSLPDSKVVEMLASENELLKAKLAVLEASIAQEPKAPAPIDLDVVLAPKQPEAKPLFKK